MRRTCLYLALFVVVSALTGCYTTGSYDRRRGEVFDSLDEDWTDAGPAYEREVNQRRQFASRKKPWELWRQGLDLEGQPLRRGAIITGDDLYLRGDLQGAVSEYRRGLSPGLPGWESDALAFRIASTELKLGDPNEARKTLGQYFRRTNQEVSQVSSDFAILFAYIYGIDGDVDQSLAWFSRAQRVSVTGEHREIVRSGVTDLLSSLPQQRFNALYNTWRTDPYIFSFIGTESDRRAGGGIPLVENNVFVRFTGQQFSDPLMDEEVSATGGTIGILLPLSGRFSALGESTKNGILLALEERKFREGVNFVVRDTAGDPDEAREAAADLMRKGVSVIMGPLLSEPAEAVAELARSKRYPLIALTKSGKLLTGNTVYRLGPTVDAQLDSLLSDLQEKLTLRRFALVYPEERGAFEFAESFKYKLAQKGFYLAYESSYFKNDTGAFGPIGEALEEEKIDAVFFPDNLTSVTRFISNISPEYRSQILVVGTGAWDNPEQISRSRKVLEGIVYVSPFFSGSTEDFVVSFRTTYRNRYGFEPNFLAAQGFDAATVVAGALKAEEQTGVSFLSALRKIEYYQGLTGSIKIDRDGEMRRRFVVVRLEADGPALLEKPETPLFVLKGADDKEEDPVRQQAKKSFLYKER